MAFLVVCLFGLKYYLANWEFIRYAESIPVARPPFEASIWVIPEGAKLLRRCALRVLFETEPYHTSIISIYIEKLTGKCISSAALRFVASGRLS